MAFQPFNTLSGKFIASGDNYNVTTHSVQTFQINLYSNKAETNRVDKTDYLTSISTLNGTLRDECSTLRPSIVIQQTSLPSFNYAYIPIFNRYYFLISVTSVGYSLWRIELNCDILMSYKDGIKNLNAIIARQENDYNDWLIDNKLPANKDPFVQMVNIPNNVLTAHNPEDIHSLSAFKYVLTVVGG